MSCKGKNDILAFFFSYYCVLLPFFVVQLLLLSSFLSLFLSLFCFGFFFCFTNAFLSFLISLSLLYGLIVKTLDNWHQISNYLSLFPDQQTVSCEQTPNGCYDMAHFRLYIRRLILISAIDQQETKYSSLMT